MPKTLSFHPSPSKLPEAARARVAGSLNERLADGLDLHAQIKVAHWNVKGPHFSSLHPLFESFAISLATFTDAIAERVVTLGVLAKGTARHVAATSRLPEYPQETTAGLAHVKLLSERIELFLDGLRATRAIAEEEKDTDTVDLLTGIVTEFEKNAWFLRATLEG
jgi:starvation-inducible DNA-binding protein